MKEKNCYCCKACDEPLEVEEAVIRGSDKGVDVLVCYNKKCRLYDKTQDFGDYDFDNEE